MASKSKPLCATTLLLLIAILPLLSPSVLAHQNPSLPFDILKDLEGCQKRDTVKDIIESFTQNMLDSFKDFPLMARFSFPMPQCSPHTSSLAKLAPFDWKETPETHVFKVDIPGMRKEEVKVEVEEGRILQISGERKIEKEGTNHTWHRAERSCGKFTRRFKLPENSKMDEIRASMENGVLTVTIPREEKKKPEVKVVEISG